MPNEDGFLLISKKYGGIEIYSAYWFNGTLRQPILKPFWALFGF
jgi:hypothetical protein